ncbi:protein disulfide oxidoreductase [Cuniculiplasma sp. SKW3]|uniref:protein disulfide oxidoreductase n=1 Tax=Cuniculiplasma sp. SKW3 TaxID=3400170 RepID=UPI003FD2393B
MALISDEYREKLTKKFAEVLKDPVTMKFFTQDDEKCPYCKDTLGLLQEMTELSPKIKLEVHQVGDEDSKKYNVEKSPVTVLISDRFPDGNVRYFGIPSGYEFSSLIEDIETFSTGNVELKEKTVEILKAIEKPVNIRVFITPTCPYCPSAVRTAHKFSLVNKNIVSDMVESYEFEEESEEAGVSSVPHITINKDTEFVGALPEDEFLSYVIEAVSDKH